MSIAAYFAVAVVGVIVGVSLRFVLAVLVRGAILQSSREHLLVFGPAYTTSRTAAVQTGLDGLVQGFAASMTSCLLGFTLELGARWLLLSTPFVLLLGWHVFILTLHRKGIARAVEAVAEPRVSTGVSEVRATLRTALLAQSLGAGVGTIVAAALLAITRL